MFMFGITNLLKLEPPLFCSSFLRKSVYHTALYICHYPAQHFGSYVHGGLLWHQVQYSSCMSLFGRGIGTKNFAFEAVQNRVHKESSCFDVCCFQGENCFWPGQAVTLSVAKCVFFFFFFSQYHCCYIVCLSTPSFWSRNLSMCRDWFLSSFPHYI